MSFKIAIRNNETGEIRTGSYPFTWSLFHWTDGNMGCDCNRHLEFLRAGGPGPEDDPHWNNVESDCGEGAYSVLYADLDDGSRVIVDGDGTL